MKRTLKTMLGVTLLEIMLVLAIAAMVIVMSVRYYQTANASSQVNTVLEQVQAISAAADSLAQASGSYATAAIGSATISPLLPTNGLTLPWGTTIAFGATTATTYNITITSSPPTQCPLIKSKLLANTHYTIATTCGTAPATTDIIVTYNSATA